jgi:hypothetical protein
MILRPGPGGRTMDDDSTENVRRTLAVSAGNRCSNPDCRVLLRVSRLGPTELEEVGVAVRTAGLDPSCHPSNGIWLCQSCANLVGNNPVQYPESLLYAWKTVAEHRAQFAITKTASRARTPSSVLAESTSRRKILAILPWKGQIVTLCERVASDTAPSLGPKSAYSLARVLGCTESHVMVSTIGSESRWKSISLENIELRIDATANQLELCVRYA